MNPFCGPLIPLLGTSGDICPGFQSQGGGFVGAQGRPSWPNFSHFHAVFRRNWPNNGLTFTPPKFVSPSGKSWIRHMKSDYVDKEKFCFFTSRMNIAFTTVTLNLNGLINLTEMCLPIQPLKGPQASETYFSTCCHLW